MSKLKERIQDVVSRAVQNNHWRQHQCINLIPSENTPSLLVKLCEISDPCGRYAEHRTMKGNEVYFYQGIDFIKDVEQEAKKEICDYFNCSQAEVRPISGQMANEIIFKAITKYINKRDKTDFKRISCVMNNDLGKGGHLSSQPMGALYNYVAADKKTGKENVVNFPIRQDNPYKIDIDRLLQIAEDNRPELVVFGKSMFIYPEPVKNFSDFVSNWDHPPVIMYDMAHVLGLYGAFQSPLEDGADIVTGSTHKTFFGPQRGVIVSNLDKGTPLRKLWLQIKSRAFPGSTSNHHLGTLLGFLLSTIEMNAFKEEYQEQVRSNAKVFAKYLADKGLKVEGDSADGFTETHQVLLRVIDYGSGEDIARRLEENNIICNYQALPDDDTFLHSSGLRMGVQEMTRYGMNNKDFEPIAQWIADVVIENKTVKEEVAKYRQKFLKQRYCLDLTDVAEFGSQLFGNILPTSDFGKLFSDRLIAACEHLSK